MRQILSVIKSAGVDLNYQNSRGSTLLMAAAAVGLLLLLFFFLLLFLFFRNRLVVEFDVFVTKGSAVGCGLYILPYLTGCLMLWNS